MTKKRFIEILVDEGLGKEIAEEIWNSPQRIPARRINEKLVRMTVRDTKIHIALEAIQSGEVSIISLN